MAIIGRPDWNLGLPAQVYGANESTWLLGLPVQERPTSQPTSNAFEYSFIGYVSVAVQNESTIVSVV